MLTNPHEVVIARREEGTSHERIWGIMAATFSRGAAKLQPTAPLPGQHRQPQGWAGKVLAKELHYTENVEDSTAIMSGCKSR